MVDLEQSNCQKLEQIKSKIEKLKQSIEGFGQKLGLGARRGSHLNISYTPNQISRTQDSIIGELMKIVDQTVDAHRSI